MRILVLTAKPPWPLTGGAEIRNFTLLREAARRHEITLVSLLPRRSDRDLLTALEPHCAKVVGCDLEPRPLDAARAVVLGLISDRPYILHRYWRRSARESLARIVRDQRIELIHAHFLHTAQYLIDDLSVATVFDPHNLEHQLWQRFAAVETKPLIRLYARTQIAKFVSWQQRIADRAHKVVTLSRGDQAEYRRIAPRVDVTTVPNGADVESFAPRDTPVEANAILYFGNLAWAPQVDAARYLHDAILPSVRERAPDTKLYLVGNEPPTELRSLASERVVVTGFVPDIQDFIARAAVVALPLRVGAGTKHRIYQALAMAKAVVTTSVGAEGMELRHEETALIADEPRDFAAQIVRLFHDEPLRRRLGENGRRFVLERHDWRAIYRQLDDVFHQARDKHLRTLAK